jgi:hypothetical protein
MSPLETACSEPIPSRSWVRRSTICSGVTGRLEKVVVDVSGELIVDSEAEFRAAMARQ